MSILDRLSDLARRLLGRKMERQLPPPGRRPPVGAYIAKEDVRMRVTVDLSEEIWRWLTLSGWRRIFLQSDRRRYRSAPRRGLERLVLAAPERREAIERAILQQAVMTTRELRRKPISDIYTKRREASATAARSTQIGAEPESGLPRSA